MSAKVLFAVLAILCALGALLGWPHVDVFKILAIGLISVAVAVIVP